MSIHVPRLAFAPLSIAACCFGAFATLACGQTVLTGQSLALHSSGKASGTGWTLSTDGYVGTYVTLSQPSTVTVIASATGASSAGVSPDLTFSIGNSSRSFAVAAGSTNDYSFTTPTLAAGTYFVRTQLDDQTATAVPTLTLASLSLGGTGLSVANGGTDANALAASNTYAAADRAGSATVTLTDSAGHALPAGTAAHVQLTRNAFNFTLAVPGQSSTFDDGTNWLNYNKSTGATIAPTPGSTQANYQNHLLQNFNSIVPENAGKWQNNEYTAGAVNLSLLDAQTQFADQHNLSERMHNLLWATQQPAFVNAYFATLNSSTATAVQKATALANLNSAIASRINYYVKGLNGPLASPRTDSYNEMDVLNESVHGQSAADNYETVLGAAGVASIYSQVATAVASVGGNTRLYTNEYNVVNNSTDPKTALADPYANWYLKEIVGLNSAGYGHVVTGTAAQCYTYYGQTTDANAAAESNTPSLSAATMMQAMQNLSVAGNPFTLSEFGRSTYGASSSSFANVPTSTAYAADLATALAMTYGNPSATSFAYWGGLGGGVDNDSAGITNLYDSNWNLTAAGVEWQSFQNAINTNLTLTTDANGQLSFTGTYGTYELTIGGQDYQFTLSLGATQIALTVVPEPAAAALVAILAIGSGLRRSRGPFHPPCRCHNP